MPVLIGRFGFKGIGFLKNRKIFLLNTIGGLFKNR